MPGAAREHAVAARRLGDLFRGAFEGAAPWRSVRAPGRVNLIGEHVDYCDLPVLPMAIQRGVSLLVRPREDGRVRLVNADARYAPRELELAEEIPPFEAGDWGNYAKAAAQALVRAHGIRRGFDAAVASDLPAAAGLSSSAALVVAVGLALVEANAVCMGPLELAELLARGERYVGTQGGGMDQAASLCGRAGCALHVAFAPLRVEPLEVPRGWRFVVAHSLRPADKSGAAREAYNARRRACEEALAHLTALPDLGASARSYPDLCAGASVAELLDLGASALPEHLLPRFRHVVSEQERVRAAREALLRSDAEAFGGLMDASHASLRDDFEVSTPELDALAALARRHGAVGARLTGAGFGGCVVALCREDARERLLAGLRTDFYAARPAHPEVDEPLLAVAPSAGASVAPP